MKNILVYDSASDLLDRIEEETGIPAYDIIEALLDEHGYDIEEIKEVIQ